MNMIISSTLWRFIQNTKVFSTPVRCFPVCRKAVGRGDKTTRQVRARVLALLGNPRQDRVRVLTLQENPHRERVRDPALQENPR
jgi:hypothetical protein